MLGFNSCKNELDKKPTISNYKNEKIDTYVKDVMRRYGIPGVAVAIVKNNEIVHENYYGLANIEHNVPVTNNTIFPLLSTTKIPVAVSIFKLIENGKINLEDNIEDYLSGLPENWKKIKIKNLLSHSSGLPDVVKYDKDVEEIATKKVYNDPIKFKAGENFDYNQTNFCLLDKIIETVTGQQFEENILEQFQHENSQVLFSNNMLEIVKNRANRYTFFNDRNQFELDAQRNDPSLHSGNGLNMSLTDFIEWNAKFQNDNFITEETKSKMWEKYNYTGQGPDFAYGWEIHTVNGRLSYAFSGGYTTEYRTYQQDDLTIIWLTNGFKQFYRTNPIINYIAGIVDEDLVDLNAINIEKVTKIFEDNDIDQAINQYYSLKKESSEKLNVGNVLNSIGYDYLRKNEIENSIKVFKLNIKENPTIWNYYDSLAEGYMNNNELKSAILFYEKASKMNPVPAYTRQVDNIVKNLKTSLKDN